MVISDFRGAALCRVWPGAKAIKTDWFMNPLAVGAQPIVDDATQQMITARDTMESQGGRRQSAIARHRRRWRFEFPNIPKRTALFLNPDALTLSFFLLSITVPFIAYVVTRFQVE